MGKLIVLEGIDGSGKSSQYKMVCEKLTADGIEYKRTVFPRYDKESSALIRMYLGGKFGIHPDDVNAYAASTFFAVDRFASFKDDWGSDYSEGQIILSDRYTTSNAVHQGSKLNDNEMTDFFDWLMDFEVNRLGLPKPDLVVYLDSSVEISLARMKKRRKETSTDADIHEKDIEYLHKCLHAADMACSYFGWVRIPYLDSDGNERNLEEKNMEIYETIRKFI